MNNSKTNLIPYLSDKNKIIGTQLIVTNENTGREPQVFVFENEIEKMSSMPCSVIIDYQGYKLYRSEIDSSMMAVMAYVMLSECIYN